MAQLYNFLIDVTKPLGPLGKDQNLVLNSTIVPMDLSLDTPYYNQELFRQYADRTFRGGIESIVPTPPVSASTRFSAQYRSLINIAVAKVDQKHPEISNSVTELLARQRAASDALNKRIRELDVDWDSVAAARHVSPGTKEYELQRVTWFAQIRYAEQIQTYSDELDTITSQLDAVRRSVYSPAEIALLDNIAALGRSYNIARPWQAITELSFKADGSPLNEILLADPTKLAPALFDSAPLILPIGDMRAFLTNSGLRSFDTNTYSSTITASSRSWTAGGSGSFLGISLGGGGSGSSSFSKSISKMTSFHADFKNIGEYFIDRSAWFNPAVLEDQATRKSVEGRPEIDNLQYVSVSLIIGRGLTTILKFSEAVNSNDWNQSSFAGGGGVSFFGFSFGGHGSSSQSSSTITVDAAGTTVTIQDGDQVGRVIGARVEKFISPSKIQSAQAKNNNIVHDANFQTLVNKLKKGDINYRQLQSNKIQMFK